MKIQQIADALVRNVVQTPDTGAPDSAVNAALATLRAKIEHKLAVLDAGKEVKDKWGGLINIYPKGHEIMPVFQVQVCKWADFRHGSNARLEYNVGHISKTHDSSGELQAPVSDAHAIYPKDAYMKDAELGKYVNAYFHELFCAKGAPLADIGDMLDALDGDSMKYKVTLSLDFYYTRPLKMLGLHKDTTGNTLFVGLHYNNREDMVGPEWMYDFWPKFKERAYSPHHSGKSGDLDKGVKFWPKNLREGLEMARKQLKKQNKADQDMLYVAPMQPNGLVAFVDELLFHQTPLTSYRKDGDRGAFDAAFNRYMLDVVKEIGPKNLALANPPRLRRQFSENKMGDYWSNRGTGGGERRSFVRFWAMVEPVVWFA